MVILLTGGAGFIGHHVAEHLLRNSDDSLVFLDRLDCSGNLNRLTEIAGWQKHKSRCRWIFHDLKAPISSQLAAQIGKVDSILHMAASTHVDRSITDPVSFVYDNVIGTAHLLEYARQAEPRKLLYFSTDEVFGPLRKAPPTANGIATTRGIPTRQRRPEQRNCASPGTTPTSCRC
jgi:dTDP-glucose 4,6-dehydratase